MMRSAEVKRIGRIIDSLEDLEVRCKRRRSTPCYNPSRYYRWQLKPNVQVWVESPRASPRAKTVEVEDLGRWPVVHTKTRPSGQLMYLVEIRLQRVERWLERKKALGEGVKKP